MAGCFLEVAPLCFSMSDVFLSLFIYIHFCTAIRADHCFFNGTTVILTFQLLSFRLTLRLYLSKSVAMTTLSGWSHGSIPSVWQTTVPAESSYHHQGTLNRVEQINYRLCMCANACPHKFKGGLEQVLDLELEFGFGLC